MANLECYVDTIHIKNLPKYVFCKIYAAAYSAKYILDYGQDLSRYSRFDVIAPGEIQLVNEAKEVQKPLPSLMSYLNYFTANGFELIHYKTDYLLLRKVS